MNQTRRDFLIQSGVAAAACGVTGAGDLAPSAMAAVATPADFPQPCPASAWQKHGIILEPDEPWEEHEIQCFMSTVEPLDDGRWRLWYGANSSRKGYIALGIAAGVPGEKFVKHRAVLSAGEPEDAPFAIGNIPPDWRLAICNHLHLKDGRHRIYFFAEGRIGGRVAQRFLAADSDDGRRYRVIDHERPCLYTVWDNTVDKKFWPGQKLEDILTNDGACVYQLPDGTFEMFVQTLEPIAEDDPRRVAYDNIPNSVRFIDRLTSEDGIKFDQRQQVLAPDKDDPIDTQFYQLTVTHTPKGRVGLLGWYRVKSGYMELQYAYSKDGIKWERVRKPWIERGKPGEPDSMTIYPPAAMIHRDDKWWLFYTGVNHTHSTLESPLPDEEQRSVVMLATTPSLWKA